MPRGSWTKKDERKYEKILDSCKLERRKGKKRTVADCKRIAAATVNRDRKVRLGSTSGGTRLSPGLRGTPEEHADRAGFYQRKLYDYLLEGKKPGDPLVERTLGQIQAEAAWVWQRGAGRDQFVRIHRATKNLLEQANALAEEGSLMDLAWGLFDDEDD